MERKSQAFESDGRVDSAPELTTLSIFKLVVLVPAELCSNDTGVYSSQQFIVVHRHQKKRSWQLNTYTTYTIVPVRMNAGAGEVSRRARREKLRATICTQYRRAIWQGSPTLNLHLPATRAPPGAEDSNNLSTA